jgi:hypothetical protein
MYNLSIPTKQRITIMQKVQMTILGKQALVDADQVKKHIDKQFCVARVIELQDKLAKENDPVCKMILQDDLRDLSSRIIKLNRTIRKNVQFIG